MYRCGFRRNSEFLLNIAYAIGGIILLIVGANMLVENASAIARAIGVSETAIGLTIVAVGTSLPELVASVSAIRSGKANLALGNIIGSNIYNLFGIMGLTGILAPSDLPVDIRFIHNPIMLLATGAMLYIMRSGSITRLHAKYCLGAYCAYTILLFSIS